MRVVFFSKRHKRSGITLHMERALLALGHEVLPLNRKLERMVGRRLAWAWTRRRVERFRPDVVLVFTFDLDPDHLAELRAVCPTATFFDDCPERLDDRIASAARASDVFFITNRGQIAQYERELGLTPAYVTGGCDPTDHFRVPPDPAWASEVAFIGTADERGGRVAVLRALRDAGLDVRVYGARWREFGFTPTKDDVYPPQYRQICNSAAVTIGSDLRHDVDLYFSNRTWLSLGCGAFLATRRVPNVHEVLKDGEHCAFFDSPGHAVEVVKRYLADPAARARIAAAGHAHAHAEFSYRRMLERMLAHPRLAARRAAGA